MIAPPEFSRRFTVAALPAEGREFRISATAAERQAICRRLSLAGLDRLTAFGRITPGPGRTIRLEGQLQADVTQTCVVTLTPVAATIAADILRRFGDEVEDEWTDVADTSIDVVLSADGDVFLEPLIEGAIDAGEVAVEQLALELDPFPRVEGAAFGGHPAEPAPDRRPPRSVAEGESPFKALAALRTKLSDRT